MFPSWGSLSSPAKEDTVTHKRANRQFLDHQRRLERMAASRAAEVLAARLQARLAPDQWQIIEEEWNHGSRYMPQERLDFLAKQAVRFGLLDLIPF